MRLTWASQVAYECFSLTAVPQTDLKHFNLESLLGYAWLPGKLTQTGLDASPEPESHGYLKLPECPMADCFTCQCCRDYYFLPNKNSLFAHSQFSNHFFSMKKTESEIIVLDSSLIQTV